MADALKIMHATRLDTVSLRKSFGSQEKQLYKHKVSETQRCRATTSYPTKNKEKSWSASRAVCTGNKYLHDHYMHRNAMMQIAPGAVNLVIR